MNKKQFLSLVSAMAIGLSLTGLPAIAADAKPVEIDGVMTSFVSSFGKISYQGSRAAYKTMDEGLASLASTGGKIVFAGNTTFSGDTLGSGKSLAFQGTGTKVTGNVLKTEQTALTAASDLSFDNLSYQVPEGAVLTMNGHSYTASDAVSAFYTSNYSTGKDTYSPSLSIYSGNAAQPYAFNIGSGNYATVALASGNVSADAVHTVSGGSFDKLIVGSTDGICDADVVLNITDGTIGELVIGAQNGKMNGKITVNISGGSVAKISTGAYGADASFDGSATVVVTGAEIGEISDSGDGKTGADVVYICLTEKELAVAESAKFTNLLSLTGGFGNVVYADGGSVAGIKCYDVNGCAAEKLVSATGEILPKDGIFTLPQGKFTGKIISSVNLGINENANYVAGYTDGTFKPGGNMTKAEAITLLTRIIADNEAAIKNGKFTNRFTDVEDGAWYEGYILFFDAVGLLNKVAGEDTVNPNAPITRAEFVQLIYNIEKYFENIDSGVSYADFSKLLYNTSVLMDNANKYDEFSDVDYTNTFGGAVYHGIVNGYVAGYENGTFMPDGNITRAEVVTVVNRVLGRIPTAGAQSTFSDVAGHWAQNQISAACTAEGAGWNRSNGKAADGTSAADYIKEKMNDKKLSDLATMVTTHLYKSASEAVAAKDITPEAKTELSTLVNTLRDTARDKKLSDVYGTAEDPRNHIYTYMGGPYIRDVVIKSNKPDTEPVYITQTSDTHFNLVNELDEKEQNPSVMSTKIYRLWLANGVSVRPVARAMAYGRYADQTIVTGDVLDYLSHGCKELVIKNLFRVDTDIMAALGNHDSTRVMQGKVSDPTSLDSRRALLQDFWVHDIDYQSKVLKDKVMCVVLDNGSSRFWDEQVVKLKADIEKARENDYIILLFYHIPLSTLNPKDTAIEPIAEDKSDAMNLYTDGIKPNSNTATTELYNLITSNGDIIKGAFCGHWHNDYYTEILATYTDANGNKVDTVIPQYVLTSTVYGDVGHVINIKVE